MTKAYEDPHKAILLKAYHHHQYLASQTFIDAIVELLCVLDESHYRGAINHGYTHFERRKLDSMLVTCNPFFFFQSILTLLDFTYIDANFVIPIFEGFQGLISL